MLRLYLTRHGETEWNVEKRMQGWLDSNLTKEGIEAAKALGERLQPVTFQAIYTSPSERTKQTARLILEKKQNKTFEIDERLREINLGKWQGKTHEEIKELYPGQYAAYFQSPHLYNQDDGETFTDVQKRAVSFMNEIIEKHQTGNILVISHGIWLKSLLNYIKNESLANFWNGSFLHGTALSVVKVKNMQYYTLEMEGCTQHLLVNN
ncbi:histidine phosphatase family protein [Bacillus sp. FJAT-47783]|uniref:histidine phosphatase family protein n=1 Tax=Bacillus sp. FJAT-47783 TaxID=2922712 RepID=UPI001FABD7DC